MNMEKKKLIAKEIPWFVFFFFVTLLIAGMGFYTQGTNWGIDWNFKTVVITLSFLYLLRAIGWAIETLFFSGKKQSKDNP